jgi:1-phosphofructokinase
MDYDLLCLTLNPSLDRELIVDDFETGNFYRINNPSNSTMEPGGKGINVSLMLADYGVNSINMGFLGGFIGSVIHDKLSNIKNVTTNFVFTTDETRENIEIVDPSKKVLTEINSLGPFIREEDYKHFIKRYKSTVSLVDHVLISGSIPPGVPINAYSELFSYAKKRGKSTYMEANGPHFDEAIMNNCPMIVRPDFRKNNMVLGSRIESIDDYIYIGKKIVDLGARLVVMSYHVVGDIIITKDSIHLFTSTEEVFSSNLYGTGDAFTAGIIHYIIKNGYDYFEAAKFGMASAIASTHYIGKNFGKDFELKECMNKFKIEKL